MLTTLEQIGEPFRVCRQLMLFFYENRNLYSSEMFGEALNSLAIDIVSITEHMKGVRPRSGLGYVFSSEKVKLLDIMFSMAKDNWTRVVYLVENEDKTVEIKNILDTYDDDIIWARLEIFEPNFGNGCRWTQITREEVERTQKQWLGRCACC